MCIRDRGVHVQRGASVEADQGDAELVGEFRGEGRRGTHGGEDRHARHRGFLH